MIRHDSLDIDNSLYVERITDLNGIDATAWDSVVARAEAPVFCSSAFVSAYHRTPLTSIDECVYLVVRHRDGDGAVAVAPAYLQRQPDPIGSLREAYPEVSGSALLTPSWHCYDGEPAAVVDRCEVLPVLVNALRETARDLGADWFGMLNVTPDGGTGTAIRDAGLPLRHIVNRYRMELTALSDLQSYFDTLGRNSRHTMRRNLRRATDAGVRTRILTSQEANLNEIADLAARTAARFGNPSFYPRETFRDFVLALGDAAGVIEIRERGRLVSAAVYLLDETRFHAWAGGVDYDVDGDYSPYRVMHAALVARAIELERPILEGGRSNGVFKSQHGLRPLPLAAMLLPVR